MLMPSKEGFHAKSKFFARNLEGSSSVMDTSRRVVRSTLMPRSSGSMLSFTGTGALRNDSVSSFCQQIQNCDKVSSMLGTPFARKESSYLVTIVVSTLQFASKWECTSRREDHHVNQMLQLGVKNHFHLSEVMSAPGHTQIVQATYLLYV